MEAIPVFKKNAKNRVKKIMYFISFFSLNSYHEVLKKGIADKAETIRITCGG